MAYVRARCWVPSDHQPGQVGWSLYYEHPCSTEGFRLLASGNDLWLPGQVLWRCEGLLPPGCYVLHARRYVVDFQVPLADDQVMWRVGAQTDGLSAGYEGDIHPPLDLH